MARDLPLNTPTTMQELWTLSSMKAPRGSLRLALVALVARGWDPDVPFEKGGLTPMQSAIQRRDVHLVQGLLDVGVDPASAHPNSHFWQALNYSESAMVKAMCATGRLQECLNQVGESGLTPLQRAGREGDIDMMEVLIKAGADMALLTPEGQDAVDLMLEKVTVTQATDVLSRLPGWRQAALDLAWKEKAPQVPRPRF